MSSRRMSVESAGNRRRWFRLEFDLPDWARARGKVRVDGPHGGASDRDRLAGEAASLLGWGLAICVALWSGPSSAQEMVAADTTADHELIDFGWSDPEEAARLLEELEASGALIAPADLHRLGLQVMDPARRDRGIAGERSRSEHGRATWRVAWRDGSTTSRVGHMRYEHSNWRTALRWREDIGAASRLSGTCSYTAASWEACAGGVGVQQGLGLLCAAPGRWRSLTAAHPLVTGSVGVKPYGGAAVRRGVWGGSASVRAGRWRLAGLWGRQQAASAGVRPGLLRVMRLASELGSGELSGAVGEMAGIHGGSLALRLEPDWGAMQAEAVAWRDSSAATWHTAWAANVRRNGERLLLAGQLAAAASGVAPALASRPAALPGWSGWGWATRGRLRLEGGATLCLLLARGRQRDQGAEGPEIHHTHRLELNLVTRPWPWLRSEMRLRRSTSSEYGWRETSPWLPPAVVATRRREQLVLIGEHRRPRLRVLVSWRSLSEVKDVLPATIAGHGRRSLLAISVDWRARTRWRVRAGWGWAWGDDLDLLSVSAPVPGVVIPRHWGAWAGESTAGIEHRADGLTLQWGMAVRHPRPGGTGRTQLQLWGRTEVRW